jgi:hypothetical protein
MDDVRPCSACGVNLVGPFDPAIDLTLPPAPDEPEREPVTVAVRAWICPACGLVDWYAQDQDLGKLPAVEPGQELGQKTDTDYERRSQMMRMLRRVRRM